MHCIKNMHVKYMYIFRLKGSLRHLINRFLYIAVARPLLRGARDPGHWDVNSLQRLIVTQGWIPWEATHLQEVPLTRR